MTILLLFAFLSGLVTIAAPCIWPLLPIILSSAATGGHRRPLGVTLGIMLSFTILTLTIAYLVRIIPFDPEILRYVAVMIISILGLTLLIPALGARLEGAVSTLSNKIRPKTSATDDGFNSGFLTGISLGIVWTPCAGPILATIATLAATRSLNGDIIFVTIAYIVGVGIPLFFFAVAGRHFFTRMSALSRYTGRIQQVFGGIMLVTALLIATGTDRTLQARLLNAFPSYSNFLLKLETTGNVQQELDRLRNNEPSNAPMPTMAFPQAGDATGLPKLRAAPDFVGITHWLNSDGVHINDLKGKVVLIDFWTYTCINCIRTLPYVTGWYEKYKPSDSEGKEDGLVVIGVHTPEFEFEKKTENVEGAIKQYTINYPVAQDNDFATWRAYDNHYWPAKYLIDADGVIRYTHFGEGDYDITEENIQKLLKEAGMPSDSEGGPADSEGMKGDKELLNIQEQTPTGQQTPETYLGLARMAGYASPERPTSGTTTYSLPNSLSTNEFAYSGSWNLQNESATVKEQGAGLLLKFYAKDVYLVITPVNTDDQIAVFVDDQAVVAVAGNDVEQGYVAIDKPRLYHLVSLKEKGEHLLQLNFQTPGTQVFAFTFGG